MLIISIHIPVEYKGSGSGWMNFYAPYTLKIIKIPFKNFPEL